MSDETSGAKTPAPDPQSAGRLKTHVVAPKPAPAPAVAKSTPPAPPARVEEIGGPPGPEPTRYGDWQYGGKVTDF